MRRINFPLLFGSIIVIFLVLLALYPGLFTSKDPLFEETPKYIEYKENGEWVEKFAHNPMPPNKDNVLGTDDAGRDVYSRLIYGTRNTLKLALLIALFRMLLALPLGLAAGMGVKFVSGIIKIFNTYFTAIPMLVFSFVVLNIGYFRSLHMDKAIYAFSIVLTIVGWAKLAGMIEDTTKRVMGEDFIEGEIAIGKTKLQIAYQNVLPHIIPTGISLFLKEMGMALFLIAQLAVLYVFVGVTRRIKDLAFKANYDMILEPEWGGTLSRIAINIGKYERVYWMVLYPILAFSTAIIGINLMGEGLRIEFQKRDSRIISYIRKAYYHLSPRVFMSQLKNIKKYYKPVLVKTLLIVGIIGYLIIPWHPSLYKFHLSQAKSHLQELTKDEYGGRVAGTRGGYLAGEYIINTLMSYGYEVEVSNISLTETSINSETQQETIYPKIISPVSIESGWIKLKDDNGAEKTYYLHKDFSIATVNKNIFSDMWKDKLNYKGIAANQENAAKVPEGSEFFSISPGYIYLHEYSLNQPNQVTIDRKRKLKYDIEFIIPGEGFDKEVVPYVFKSTAIYPFDELRKDLESGYREMEISFDYPKVAEHPARNIMAFLPGNGKTMEDPGEIIIIGASYDGVYQSADREKFVMTAAPAATALEIARILSLLENPLEKSIQFIFWDNESETQKYTPLSGSGHYHLTEQRTIDMALTHGYYYIDISYPGYEDDQYLNLITLPAQRADGKSYLVGLDIEKRLKQMDVKYRRFHYDYSISEALIHLRLNAFSSIGIGNPSTGGINTSLDNMENINYKRIEDVGQTIIDTMTMSPHIMD